MVDLLYAVGVAPFKDMAGAPAFLIEVLIGGIFAGLMYSLVALGFVLIFKASGVFNFAQGVMVLFAALTLVGLLERGAPVVVALALTTVVMVALAFAIERLVLRPLVNQAHIILFMATIATTPATDQTTIQMVLSGTPIESAASWSSATARRARPMRVRWKNTASKVTRTAAVTAAVSSS